MAVTAHTHPTRKKNFFPPISESAAETYQSLNGKAHQSLNSLKLRSNPGSWKLWRLRNPAYILPAAQFAAASHLSRGNHPPGFFPSNKSLVRLVVQCEFVVFLGSHGQATFHFRAETLRVISLYASMWVIKLGLTSLTAKYFSWPSLLTRSSIHLPNVPEWSFVITQKQLFIFSSQFYLSKLRAGKMAQELKAWWSQFNPQVPQWQREPTPTSFAYCLL